jgi:hypothetical protein
MGGKWYKREDREQLQAKIYALINDKMEETLPTTKDIRLLSNLVIYLQLLK